MKQRIRVFLGGIALISLLFFASGDVLAKRNKTIFSGEMTFSMSLGGNCGEFTCPGGVDTSELKCYGPPFLGGTFKPCSPGSNFHMRDREMVFYITTGDPDDPVNGKITFLANWNWKYVDTPPPPPPQHRYSGPMWGTFILEVDLAAGGGTWEGSFTGHWDGTAPVDQTTTLSFVGHGEGGDIDGMQIKMEAAGGFTPADIVARIH